MDAKTEELKAAHDVLAAFYREQADGLLEKLPIVRGVLGMFCELTLAAGLGRDVADIGCGTGHLAPFLAAQGVWPRGVDLSPGMVKLARQDFPEFSFEEGDVRALPLADASLAGVVCWYSLIFLAPADRPIAFGELARVVKPGGYLVTGFKDGDGKLRRSGRSAGLGVEWDGYWLPTHEVEAHLTAAGFTIVFRGGRPAEEGESTPQGYLIARRG
ncbi:class I SAM-dependent methyltransferase [Asanoa iriomotensis]|uniref:Methyltransferase n=1 Tax=Asanoa iriomotensis TaxID=234613 RepID=A0ABQ4BWB1_9ACTN|nr:class I SAM-dependent methyltransferase [Asanoa iriomotensis]GIF54819.1 methyltransferase [Asanoa iriomotensis]